MSNDVKSMIGTTIHSLEHKLAFDSRVREI